jgi:hypothetical protein
MTTRTSGRNSTARWKTKSRPRRRHRLRQAMPQRTHPARKLNPRQSEPSRAILSSWAGIAPSSGKCLWMAMRLRSALAGLAPKGRYRSRNLPMPPPRPGPHGGWLRKKPAKGTTRSPLHRPESQAGNILGRELEGVQMSVMLLPVRHLLNTCFQKGYLFAHLLRPIKQLPILEPRTCRGQLDEVVFA